MINTVAPLARDLLIERTQAGLAHAKSREKILERPKMLSELKRTHTRHQRQEGKTVAAIARYFKTSRQTIMRIRDTINN